MTNKEKIYKYVQKQFLIDQKHGEDKGVETKTVADYLQIKRPNASSLLNKLVKEGLLTKSSTRPVYYHLSEKITHTAFDDLIGSTGSLSEAVKSAKAAINFPNEVLPINIRANKGNGISYFEKSIINYAKEQKKLPQDAKIHVINCIFNDSNADEINLRLFGKNGYDPCFNHYQNDVVIINNYEKLSFTQTYQLNNLLDQTQDYSGNLIILASTPANSNRINVPIQIVLPDLDKRPISEKLAFIESMFEKQAKNSGRSIIVGTNIIAALIEQNYPQGFKDLIKIITFACAKSYLRSLDDGQTEMHINAGDFPDTFIVNKTLDITSYQNIQNLTNNREKFIFEGKVSKDNQDFERKYGKTLYEKINSGYENLSSEGLASENINNTVLIRIKQLFNEYGFHENKNVHNQKRIDLEELNKIVPEEIISLTENFLDSASKSLSRKFNANIFYGLCLHLNSMINLGTISSRQLDKKRISEIQSKYPQEYDLTKELVYQIGQKFSYQYDQTEIALIVLFLIEPKHETTHPVVLYAMHGGGVAHYLSEVTNTLNHSHNTYAYDMQLDKDIEKVYQELKTLVLKINQGKGIIVIYDMGSFKTLFNRIIDETNVPIRLINIPITLTGLETARKSMTAESIDDVYHNIVSNLNNFRANNENDKQNLIITLCHTGEGGAVQLKDYIDQYSQLNYIVKPMSISNREALAREVQRLRKVYNIKAFIGTYNPNLFGIPFISITKIFENSHDDLDKVLSFMPINSDSAIFDKIYAYYQKELKYTRIDTLKETMPQVMDMINEQYSLNEDQQIGVFTHIVGIIENTLAGHKRENITISPNVQQSLKEDFSYIGSAFKPLEKKFNIIFNDSDLYTTTAIIKQL